jgi:hypothetical protein
VRSVHVASATLAVGLFGVALAVAGLAVGVIPVPRRFELAAFLVAIGSALVAVGLTLRRLLQQSADPPTRVSRETSSDWLRQLDERQRRVDWDRTMSRLTMALLACSLLAGAAVAMLRTEAARRTPPPQVVEPASGPGNLGLTVVLAGAGAALVLGMALLLRGAKRKMLAVGATAAGLGALTATGTLSLGGFNVDPHVRVAPTKVEQSTLLLSLQTGPHVTLRPQLTMSPRLTLGGLRIPIALHGGRASCHCKKKLPCTR